MDSILVVVVVVVLAVLTIAIILALGSRIHRARCARHAQRHGSDETVPRHHHHHHHLGSLDRTLASCRTPKILILIKAHDVRKRPRHGSAAQFAGAYACLQTELARHADQVDFRLVFADPEIAVPLRDEPADHRLTVRTEENYWSGLLIKVIASLSHPIIEPYDFVLVMNASTFVNVPALVQFCTSSSTTAAVSHPVVYGHLWVGGNSQYPFTFPHGLGFLLNRAAIVAVTQQATSTVEYRPNEGYRCRVPTALFPSTDDIFVGWLATQGHLSLSPLPSSHPTTWGQLLKTDPASVLVRLRNIDGGKRLVAGHEYLAAHRSGLSTDPEPQQCVPIAPVANLSGSE